MDADDDFERPALAVRPAEPGDLDFVAGLAPRFAESRPPWRTHDEIALGTAAELRRAFASPEPGAALFVAEDETGERVGFAYVVTHVDFFTREPHGHLSEIAVTRDGAGIGRALVAAVERHVRELGLRFLTLNVHEHNARGHAFYTKLGFEPNTRQYAKTLAPDAAPRANPRGEPATND
jgi:ribosomal protein S18 acetylase RimI-like enzyme